jgi:hypothetical protein
MRGSISSDGSTRPSLGGRRKIASDLRALIRRMSAENPLWGADFITIMSFQEELLQPALFGADRIFTPAKATTADIEEHALVLTHDDGAGTVRPDGQGKRTPRRSSSCRIEWRSADGVTPRCAAAGAKA